MAQTEKGIIYPYNYNEVADVPADLKALAESIDRILSDYSLSTDSGNKIVLEMNNTTYKIKAVLKDKDNNVINTSNEIDLPLENMVTNISYNNQTLTLTHQDGQTTEVSIADLISDLASKEEVTELQSQVDDLTNLVETELDSNTVEGTEIDVSDSAEYRGRIEVKGNTEQKQLSGKNLLNFSKWTSKEVNGVRWTNNGDGTVTANGTATDNSDFYVIKDYSTKYTGDYTISGCPTGGSATTYYVLQDIGNKSDFGNGVTKSFNNESFAVRLRIMKGYTANGILFRPMIELGITKTDFEPYCGGQPSPNPDYPQPIKVATGDNVVKHVGKNEFYGEDLHLWYSSESNVFQNTSNFFKSLICKVKPNTQYTISKKNASNRFVLITSENKPKVNASYLRKLIAVPNSNRTEYSFTTLSNENYIFFGVYSGTDETEIAQAIEEIQLEQGTTATSYEPYRGEDYNLNLGSIELCKIGDYSDILFKNEAGDENYNAELESGAWYKKKAIDKKVLDDSWTWFNNATNRFSVEIAAPNGDYVLSALCDKYINALNWTAHTNTDKSFIVRNGDWGANKCRISFLDSYYASLAEWTQFVSENNLIVYHRLLNPTYEKITDSTLISQLEALKKAKWFKGINHWWTETENLEPVLKGTYKQSNNLRLQALEQAVVALGGV